MAKQLLIVFFLLGTLTSISQEVTRIKITGKITASKGEDVEGISIYNKSSQKGTITNSIGGFELKVAENDRVLITAMQFQSFTVIIDKGVIEAKEMNVLMNPVVNQLDEVLIRPYDLSGNINADLKRINVVTFSKDWDLSYKTLEFGYEFTPDAQTSIKGNKAEDAYFNGMMREGADIIGLATLIVSSLLPTTKHASEKEKNTEADMVSNALQQRFGIAYIASEYKIPEEKVMEFIYFVEENGLNKNLLKPKNELLLIEYLQEQSKIYLKQLHEK